MLTKEEMTESQSSLSTEARILTEVFTSMKNFGAPMLLDKKYWAESARMADAGLLKRHEAVFKTFGYSLTPEGLKAFQSLPAAEPQPLVKAWGDKLPKTRKAKIAFIASQAKPLERAKYLDHTTGEGKDEHTASYTLAESALDAKLQELGYRRDSEECREHFNFGDEESDCFYLCDETGALLDGNWSDEPDDMIYFMSGFAWRRENGFQMEDRDWQEAHGYLSRLDHKEAAELVNLICESCFLEPRGHNDTGLYNPGGPCSGGMDELIALFDFMKESPDPAEVPRG